MIGQIGTWGLKRVLLIFVSVWLVIFFFTALPRIPNRASNQYSNTADRLSRTLMEIDSLRKKNNELLKLFRVIIVGELVANETTDEEIKKFKRLIHAERTVNNNQDFRYVRSKEEPHLQYEVYRRRISTNVQEFWSYIHTELTNLQNISKSLVPNLMNTINTILNMGAQHKRSLLHDIQTLTKVDGYASWRVKESNELSNLVQARLNELQNPKDCKRVKKLVCNLNISCGYGCQLHHVVLSFIVAYGTKRTLILKSKGWNYHPSGWDEVFKPISETCTNNSGETTNDWPGTPNTQALTLPIGLFLPRPQYLPPAIPEDLAPRLIRLHGDPIVWWVGQFLKYLLRPQDQSSNLIQETIAKIGFKKPIVGVHVRRTDKIRTEASFHGIEEYMTAVEEYYNQLELKQKVNKRRIYIASDEPKVISDARIQYPHYEILGAQDVANLSVCRMAYEIMQNYYPDAADKFKSLDDIYYFDGQNAHNRIAVLPHEAQKSSELTFSVGELIGVAGNHWNGYSMGTNYRTRQIGLYPSFKVRDIVKVTTFPS